MAESARWRSELPDLVRSAIADARKAGMATVYLEKSHSVLVHGAVPAGLAHRLTIAGFESCWARGAGRIAWIWTLRETGAA